MAQFDLTANAWVEVVTAGGSNPQQIVIGLGEALVSLGAPDALTNAIKLGGSAGRSLSEGRMLTAPAGVSVWMRPVGPRVLGYIGQASGGTPTPTPTPAPSFTAQPSISPSSGNTGQTFTATDGTVTNGSVTGRRWLLSGTAIGTGTTVIPSSSGSLVLENTATDTNGQQPVTATSAPVTVVAAGTPAVTALAAPQQGASGNLVTYPQAVMGKGPASDKFMTGAVIQNGNQVARLYDHATGTLIEPEHVVRAVDAKDDHNPCADASYSDGSFLAVGAGHNSTSVLSLSERSAAGVWTDYTLTYPDVLCYPNLFVDKNGTTWLIIRRGNTTWNIRSRTTYGNGAADWGNTFTFLTNGNQIYADTIRYDPVTHKINMFVRPNSEDAQFGALKAVQFDCATGEFFDGNGALGKLGAASANGKTLPFAYSAVATTTPKPTGRAYGVTDMSPDGKSLMVRNRDDTNLADQQVEFWTLTGSNRFVDASYTKSLNITNMGSVLAGGGNNNPPGGMIDRAPISGYAFFVAKGVTDESGNKFWSIERYTSPDAVTWTRTILARRLTQISRPQCIEGARIDSPVNYVEMRAYVDFASYGSANTQWLFPTLASSNYFKETFTAAADTALTAYQSTVADDTKATYAARTGVGSGVLSVSSANGRTFGTVPAGVTASTRVAGSSGRAQMLVSRKSTTANAERLGVNCSPDPAVFSGVYLTGNNGNGAKSIGRFDAGVSTSLINYTGSTLTDGDVLEIRWYPTPGSPTLRTYELWNNCDFVQAVNDPVAPYGDRIDLVNANAATTTGGGAGHDAILISSSLTN